MWISAEGDSKILASSLAKVLLVTGEWESYSAQQLVESNGRKSRQLYG